MVYTHVFSCCVKQKKSMLNGTDTYVWNPVSFLNSENTSAKYALIILNQPITVEPDLMISLWNRATVKLTVDGGTNRWCKFLKECTNEQRSQVQKQSPDIICGDLDSLEQDALKDFTDTTVRKTPDQNETDFTKSLRILNEWLIETSLSELDGVIALCDTSGRFDQIMANINTLLKSKKVVGHLPVYQLAANSLTWVLQPGSHSIAIPDQLITSLCWCSLLPIGEKATCVTTTGLKWNLDHRSMEFGELVSTSNTYDGDPHVTVTTETNLIWSMGLANSDS